MKEHQTVTLPERLGSPTCQRLMDEDLHDSKTGEQVPPAVWAGTLRGAGD